MRLPEYYGCLSMFCMKFFANSHVNTVMRFLSKLSLLLFNEYYSFFLLIDYKL